MLVCTLQREGNSLCCGSRGSELYHTLKAEVLATQDWDVWITETSCLGWCHKEGPTVAVYPEGQIFRAVSKEEALELLKDS